MSSNEFEQGDMRGDRGPGKMFTLSSDEVDAELAKEVAEPQVSQHPELDEVIVTDTVEQKKRKILTLSNLAFLLATGFIISLGYMAVTSTPTDSSVQKVAAAKTPDSALPVKSQTSNTRNNPAVQEQVAAAEVELLRKDLHDLRQKLDVVVKELESRDKNSLKSADLEGRLTILETYVSEQAKLKQSVQPIDNDIITRVMAHVIPEIKKYSDANAARIRNDISKNFESKASGNANHNKSTTEQHAVRPSIPTVAQNAKQPILSNTSESGQVNEAQARDLVFVMATNDLMLVTAKDDLSQRIITLKPDEFVKGRGIVQSISPRGCIVFTDGSTYEVLNREGSCTKAQ